MYRKDGLFSIRTPPYTPPSILGYATKTRTAWALPRTTLPNAPWTQGQPKITTEKCKSSMIDIKLANNASRRPATAIN